MAWCLRIWKPDRRDLNVTSSSDYVGTNEEVACYLQAKPASQWLMDTLQLRAYTSKISLGERGWFPWICIWNKVKPFENKIPIQTLKRSCFCKTKIRCQVSRRSWRVFPSRADLKINYAHPVRHSPIFRLSSTPLPLKVDILMVFCIFLVILLDNAVSVR